MTLKPEKREHTPGPWTIEEYGDDDAPALVIHKDSETRICFMPTPGSHGDPAKIEADAHLIATAPAYKYVWRNLSPELRHSFMTEDDVPEWVRESLRANDGGAK